MKKLLAVAVAAACCLPATAFAQNAGTWVLAPWKGSAVRYPGVVQSTSGGMVNVQFDDGDVARVPSASVRLYDWRVGTRVVCQWTDGKDYPGKITRLNANGSNIDVLYDDGDRQSTTTGKCHTPG